MINKVIILKKREKEKMHQGFIIELFPSESNRIMKQVKTDTSNNVLCDWSKHLGGLGSYGVWRGVLNFVVLLEIYGG